MNLKTILVVIVLAILIGIGIVFLPKLLNQSQITSNLTLPTAKTPLNSPTPTPIPTKPPVVINESSDLNAEINKIEIPDFKQDFESLKSELN